MNSRRYRFFKQWQFRVLSHDIPFKTVVNITTVLESTSTPEVLAGTRGSRLARTFTCLAENEKPSLFCEQVHVNQSSLLSRREMTASRTLRIPFGTGMSCLPMKVNILDDSDTKTRLPFKSSHKANHQSFHRSFSLLFSSIHY